MVDVLLRPICKSDLGLSKEFFMSRRVFFRRTGPLTKVLCILIFVKIVKYERTNLLLFVRNCKIDNKNAIRKISSFLKTERCT